MRFLVLLGIALTVGSAFGQHLDVPTLAGKPLFVPGEVLVRLKASAADSDKARVLGAKAQTSTFESAIRVYRMELGATEDVQSRVEQLKNDPAVELAQPNYYYYTSGSCVPTDVYYSAPYNWPLLKIQAPKAWGLFVSCPPEPTGAAVTVAILDTGYYFNHPDLIGVARGPVTDCISGGNDPADQFGHGTFVAGIIAAQWNASTGYSCPSPSRNTTGMAGLASGIVLMPIRVLDACGSGTSAQIAAGTLFAVNNGARVLNFSLGGAGTDDLEDEAVQQALSAGCVVVAASGNQSNLPQSLAPLNYPAAYPGVISVGATDENDKVAFYSNGGTGLDLVAPGGAAMGGTIVSVLAAYDIFSTLLCPTPTPCAGVTGLDFIEDSSAPGPYGVASGTSAAAPYVTATAALIFSMYPNLTNIQVVDAIVNNTDSLNNNTGWDAQSGYGRLNVYKALLNAQSSAGQITPYVKTFNSPNPFYPDINPTTNITLVMTSPQAVDLTIRDSGGGIVLHKIFQAGQLNENPANPQFKSFYVPWDGRNSSGQLVTTGVYFYSIVAGGVTGRNKIAVVRGNP